MRFRKAIYLLLALFTLFCVVQCKKEKRTDGDVALSGKSLTEIRAIIRGDWLVARRNICGIAGCGTVYYDPSAADIFSFLPADTLKETAHAGTPIYRYEKADSIKYGQLAVTGQPAWTFYFSTAMTFTKIHNDTLVVESGYGEIGLVRKQ